MDDADWYVEIVPLFDPLGQNAGNPHEREFIGPALKYEARDIQRIVNLSLDHERYYARLTKLDDKRNAIYD